MQTVDCGEGKPWRSVVVDVDAPGGEVRARSRDCGRIRSKPQKPRLTILREANESRPSQACAFSFSILFFLLKFLYSSFNVLIAFPTAHTASLSPLPSSSLSRFATCLCVRLRPSVPCHPTITALEC